MSVVMENYELKVRERSQTVAAVLKLETMNLPAHGMKSMLFNTNFL